MRLMFVTAHLYLPQIYGGMQFSVDQLSKLLLAKGHKVSVVSSLASGGYLGLRCRANMKLFRRGVSRDEVAGYPVWRSWQPWGAIPYVVAKEKPDLAIVLAMGSVRMAKAARESGMPFLMVLQDVEFFQHDGQFEELGNIPCVANSKFTARRYRDVYGVNPTVIYPIIDSSRYRTATTRENVTFINPVAVKGCNLALEIARRCPEIPFSFVESWSLKAADRRELMRALSELSNVTFVPTQSDMRKVYGKCRILLAPSVWEEAYGRVVTEAQLSGIPVIASNRGGLPEAVGAGGVLLDPDDPIDNWVDAVKKLWTDQVFYEEMSERALVHGNRREIDPVYLVKAWEDVFQTTCRNVED